jgi:lysozyme
MARAFTTARCLDLLHQFEGLYGKPRLLPAKDPAGNWEIGWGHKLASPDYPQITPEQADTLAVADLNVAAEAVEAALSAPVASDLTQGQWDALCCFTYNEGGSAFRTSTLCRMLRLGFPASTIAQQFDRWVFAHDPKTGRVVELQGLHRRRDAEKAMFLS